MSVLCAVGCTLLASSTTMSPLSLSAQIIVPVNPVCPKELSEKRVPHGGLLLMGNVSHPSALLFSQGNPSTLVQKSYTVSQGQMRAPSGVSPLFRWICMYLVRSAAVENNPACPATPSNMYAVGSCTTPRISPFRPPEYITQVLLYSVGAMLYNLGSVTLYALPKYVVPGICIYCIRVRVQSCIFIFVILSTIYPKRMKLKSLYTNLVPMGQFKGHAYTKSMICFFVFFCMSTEGQSGSSPALWSKRFWMVVCYLPPPYSGIYCVTLSWMSILFRAWRCMTAERVAVTLVREAMSKTVVGSMRGKSEQVSLPKDLRYIVWVALATESTQPGKAAFSVFQMHYH